MDEAFIEVHNEEDTVSQTEGVDVSLMSNGDPEIKTQHGTSWYFSVLIIVNAGLGAGLLAFPKAYDKAGGVPIALTFQVILAAAAYGALLILAHCADRRGTASYQDTVATLCGRRVKILCSLIIALYCFGTCITFLIIIGDQLDRVIYYITKDTHFDELWYLNRKFTISISSLVFVLPLCLAKRIDFLRYPSAVGVIGVLYIGALIIAEYFMDLPPPGPIKTTPDSWADVFFVIPVICFGYQCHLSAVPIYGCMRGRPNLRLFSLASGLAILICMLAYISTGVFGYYTFGSHVSPDVLVDYPPTPAVLTGLILLAIKTYTTYPILYFCGRLALETCFADILGWNPARLQRHELYRRIGCTLIWYGVSLILAVYVPNIDIVIGLLGGIAGLFIFVFPGLCLFNLCLSDYEERMNLQQRTRMALACVYIVFGMFLFGLTTTQSIMDIVHKLTHPSLSGTASSPLTLISLMTSGHFV